MIFKTRQEPPELTILRVLNKRMELPEDEKLYYFKLKKGYEGEQYFDSLLLQSLKGERLILNDLLFKFDNTLFQIDSLIISQHTVHTFELKHHEGDYHFENDDFHSSSGKKMKNPVHQLNRSETLFRNMLNNLGCQLPLEPKLVFTHPEFFLYQAPRDLAIIYHPQLNRFLKKFNSKPSKLNAWHTKLAEKLVAAHIPKSPYSQIPDFSYEKLKKGTTCSSCNSFFVGDEGKKLVCKDCGCEEDIESAVLRSVKEFQVLFPERKVTTGVVWEWCGVIESRKKIRRILISGLVLKHHGRFSYFE
ncbi:nuclease-related domain-containing protein [Bacillus sp. FJAT-27251]|uniref:nuclease-related domain-containing protein n=1 Tax=Bacillus sp. FJAT-27251 TaxID=1684142 RepID=UPI0006A7DEDF|nr:nuclease-related domain-containing protein [Bacillus sp. FJAT-27251]